MSLSIARSTHGYNVIKSHEINMMNLRNGLKIKKDKNVTNIVLISLSLLMKSKLNANERDCKVKSQQ